MTKRWYVVHTYSGYEKKVKTDLEHRIETMGMQDRIFDIEIPIESVTEIKEGGKRETKDVKIFPGYVLVRMEMDDDAWTCVRNTQGVKLINLRNDDAIAAVAKVSGTKEEEMTAEGGEGYSDETAQENTQENEEDI